MSSLAAVGAPLTAALAAVRAHPRHLVLAALVAGLLAAPAPPLPFAVAILAAATAGRAAVAVVAAAAVLAGAVIADARLAAMDRTALRTHLGQSVAVRAALLEAPRRSRSNGRSALAQVVRGPGSGERVLVRAGRRTRWPAATPGAVVSIAGRLAALGSRDGHQHRRGAHAVLIAGRVAATGTRRGGLAGLLDRARSRAETAVSSGLDPPRAALAQGMVLGRDERLSEPVRADFRDSGLAHLLAASGQNVMLLAALALAVLGGLGIGLRGRLAGALVLIALYVPLAGAGPSIQRAGVMGAAAIVATLAGRPASRWYALLLAAAITLVANPRAAGDPGWQLSFAAVAAIAVASPRMRVALTARRVPAGVAEAAALSAAATLGTAPLLAFHFDRVSLVSLPANLLAVPAVAPVMWLGMLAAAAGPLLPPVGLALNALAQFPLAYLGWLAQAAAGLPAAALPLQIGSVGALVAVYATGAAGLLSRRVRGPVVVTAVAALGLALAFSGPAAPPDPRVLRVSFLDIGQGDATLLQRGGATVLVDTGPPGSPLLQRLRESGARRIDVLVVTHAQADHEGGAVDVLSHHPVGLLVDGGDGTRTPEHRAIVSAARRLRVPRVAPDVGQVMRAGPLVMRVLWPPREPFERHAGEDPNERAMVLHVRDGAIDVLLPADAESPVTGALDLPPSEVLKVAHHGSEDPGLPDLLRTVRPRVAVIEVGRHNTYGHPRPATLAALRAVPLVRRTDRDGTVRLTADRGRLSVATDP